MPSFTHKKLIDRITLIDKTPLDPEAYATWIKAGGHLDLLRDNADEDELIVYACGPYAFIHAAAVSNDKLHPIDQDDLLGWSCNPYRPISSYVSGGDQEGVWIEPGMRHIGAKTLEDAKQLVFAQNFTGWGDASERHVDDCKQLFYRQKIAAGHAGYTRGVQIVHSTYSRGGILSAMKAELFEQRGKQYVEFTASDWRNKRITRISS